jgi:hypothetical protein
VFWRSLRGVRSYEPSQHHNSQIESDYLRFKVEIEIISFVINHITVALSLEIMMNLHEMGWDEGGMDWIDLAEDRDCWLALVNS